MVGVVAFLLFIIETVSGGIDPVQKHTFEVRETRGAPCLKRPYGEPRTGLGTPVVLFRESTVVRPAGACRTFT